MLFKHLESVFTLLFYYVNSLHLIVISRKGIMNIEWLKNKTKEKTYYPDDEELKKILG